MIDANILFAALIADNKTSELIFSEKTCLFAPELLFEEFKRYKTLLLDKTKREEQAFIQAHSALKRRIHIIKDEELEEYKERARRICPDESDIPFFSAAFALGIPLWSNDKKLKAQRDVEVITTQELLERIS